MFRLIILLSILTFAAAVSHRIHNPYGFDSPTGIDDFAAAGFVNNLAAWDSGDGVYFVTSNDDGCCWTAWVFCESAAGARDWNSNVYELSSPLGFDPAFGRHVAIDQDHVVVGSVGATHNAYSEGAAYVYTASSVGATDWNDTLPVILLDPAGSNSDEFGNNVAILDLRIVVSQVDKGSVWIFTESSVGVQDWNANAVELTGYNSHYVRFDGQYLALGLFYSNNIQILAESSIGMDDWGIVIDHTLGGVGEYTFIDLDDGVAVASWDYMKVDVLEDAVLVDTIVPTADYSYYFGRGLCVDNRVIYVSANIEAGFVLIFRESVLDAQDWSSTSNPFALTKQPGLDTDDLSRYGSSGLVAINDVVFITASGAQGYENSVYANYFCDDFDRYYPCDCSGLTGIGRECTMECLNGGTVSLDTSVHNETGLPLYDACACAGTGFSGTVCDTDEDDCLLNVPCGDNICTDQGTFAYVCGDPVVITVDVPELAADTTIKDLATKDIDDWLAAALSVDKNDFVIRYVTHDDIFVEITYTITIEFRNQYNWNETYILHLIQNIEELQTVTSNTAIVSVTSAQSDNVLVVLDATVLVGTIEDFELNVVSWCMSAIGGVVDDYQVRWIVHEDGTYTIYIDFANRWNTDVTVLIENLNTQADLQAAMVSTNLTIAPHSTSREAVITLDFTGLTGISLEHFASNLSSWLQPAIGAGNMDDWGDVVWTERSDGNYTVIIVFNNPFELDISVIELLVKEELAINIYIDGSIDVIVTQKDAIHELHLTFDFVDMVDITMNLTQVEVNIVSWLLTELPGYKDDFNVQSVQHEDLTYTVYITYANPYVLHVSLVDAIVLETIMTSIHLYLLEVNSTVSVRPPTHEVSITLTFLPSELDGVTIDDFVQSLPVWCGDVLGGDGGNDFEITWVQEEITLEYTVIIIFDNRLRLHQDIIETLIKQSASETHSILLTCVVIRADMDGLTITLDFPQGEDIIDIVIELRHVLIDVIGGNEDDYDLRYANLPDGSGDYRVVCVFLNPYNLPVDVANMILNETLLVKESISLLPINPIVIVVVHTSTLQPLVIELKIDTVSVGTIDDLQRDLEDIFRGVLPRCGNTDLDSKWVEHEDGTWSVLVHFTNRYHLDVEIVTELLETTSITTIVTTLEIIIHEKAITEAVTITITFTDYTLPWNEADIVNKLPGWIAPVTCWDTPQEFGVPHIINNPNGNFSIVLLFVNIFHFDLDVLEQLIVELPDLKDTVTDLDVMVVPAPHSKEISITLEFIELVDITIDVFVDSLPEWLADLLGGTMNEYTVQWVQLPDDLTFSIMIICPDYGYPDLVEDAIRLCSCITDVTIDLEVTIIQVHPIHEVSIVLEFDDLLTGTTDDFVNEFRDVAPIVCGGGQNDYVPLDVTLSPTGTYIVVFITRNVFAIPEELLEELVRQIPAVQERVVNIIINVEVITHAMEFTLRFDFTEFQIDVNENSAREELIDVLVSVCGGSPEHYGDLDIITHDDGTLTLLVFFVNIYHIPETTVTIWMDEVTNTLNDIIFIDVIITVTQARPVTELTVHITFDDFEYDELDFQEKVIEWLVITCGGLPIDYHPQDAIINVDLTLTVMVIIVSPYHLPKELIDDLITGTTLPLPGVTSVSVNFEVEIIQIIQQISIVIDFDDFKKQWNEEQVLNDINDWIAEWTSSHPTDFDPTPRIVTRDDGTITIIVFWDNRRGLDEQLVTVLINTCPELPEALKNPVLTIIPSHTSNPVTITLIFTDYVDITYTDEDLLEALKRQLPEVCAGLPRDFTFIIDRTEVEITVYITYVNTYNLPIDIIERLVNKCPSVSDTVLIDVTIVVTPSRPKDEVVITLRFDELTTLTPEEFEEQLLPWISQGCGGSLDDYRILTIEVDDVSGEYVVTIIFINIIGLPVDILETLIAQYPPIVAECGGTLVVTVIITRVPREVVITIDVPELSSGGTLEELEEALKEWLPITCGGVPRDYTIHVVIDVTITIIIIFDDTYELPEDVFRGTVVSCPYVETYCPGITVTVEVTETPVFLVPVVITCGGWEDGSSKEEFEEGVREWLPTTCGGVPQDYDIQIIELETTVTITIYITNVYNQPTDWFDGTIISCPYIESLPDVVVVIEPILRPIYTDVIVVEFNNATIGTPIQDAFDRFREFIVPICGGIPSDYPFRVIPNDDPAGPAEIVVCPIVNYYNLNITLIKNVISDIPEFEVENIVPSIGVTPLPPPNIVTVEIIVTEYVNPTDTTEFQEELQELIESICGCSEREITIVIVDDVVEIEFPNIHDNDQTDIETLIAVSPVIDIHTVDATVEVDVISTVEIVEVTVVLIPPTTFEEFLLTVPVWWVDDVCLTPTFDAVTSADGLDITVTIVIKNVCDLPVDTIVEDITDGLPEDEVDVNDVDVAVTHEDFDPCLSSPCFDGGVCELDVTSSIAGMFSCVAPPVTFTCDECTVDEICVDNDHCESSPCLSSPCAEGLTCVVVDSVTYNCSSAFVDDTSVTIAITLSNVTNPANITDFVETLPTLLAELLGGDPDDYLVTVAPVGDGKSGEFEIVIEYTNENNIKPDIITNTIADSDLFEEVTDVPVSVTTSYDSGQISPDGSADEPEDKDAEDNTVLIIVIVGVFVIIVLLILGWYLKMYHASNRKMIVGPSGETMVMPV